jgi:hypothetical protein
MKILRIVVCCALAAALPVAAQKTCSKADAANAEKAIDRVVNWPGLQKAYQDYRHCDSDAVNDLFTDALLRLMVEWKNVDVVSSAVAKDGEYKNWIHKRLLSPAAKDDRESVYSRAKASCPAKQEAFCAELAEVVQGGKPGGTPAASDPLNFELMKPIGSSAPAKK